MLCGFTAENNAEIDFTKPLTKEQLNNVAIIIRGIEKDPLSEESYNLQKELLSWIIQTDDIFITLYGYLAENLNDDFKLKSFYIVQHSITLSAVIIENPHLKDNPQALELLALNRLLIMYEYIKNTEGKSSESEYFDKLIAMRDSNELKNYIDQITQKDKLASIIDFPDNLAGMSIGEFYSFEEKYPGLGFSVGYNSLSI